MHLALLCVCHKFELCSTEIAAEILIYLFIFAPGCIQHPQNKKLKSSGITEPLRLIPWLLLSPDTEMWTSSQQFIQHILSSLHALLVC